MRSVAAAASGEHQPLDPADTPEALTEKTDALIADLQRRDSADSTRAVAPLRMAEGAFLLDSSDLSLAQVVERILEHHRIHG